MVTEPGACLFDLLSVLERLSIGYALGGSVASSIFGEPRATADIDLIAALRPRDIDPFKTALSESFYIPEEAMAQAVARQGSFNLIHLESMQKIDIFVAGAGLLDREQLRTRRFVAAAPRPFHVTDPEVLIVRKLACRGDGEVSEHQWRDALGVLKAQAGRLDEARLAALAGELGLGELLERARGEAGLAPGA